jgi:hypothetical protein
MTLPRHSNCSMRPCEQSRRPPRTGPAAWFTGRSPYRRYESAGALDDLDRAVDGLDQATRATGAGCVDTGSWTVNLAAVLHERARRTGGQDDLNQAISLLETVSAPGTFADRTAAMNDLGNTLRDRHHATGNEADLDRAIQILRAALATAPPGSAQSATLLANLGVMAALAIHGKRLREDHRRRAALGRFAAPVYRSARSG